MRIGILGPAPPWRGGISQFALDLALELTRQGHQVRMFTFTQQYPPLIFPGGDQKGQFNVPEEISIRQCHTPYLPWTWPKAVQEIRDFGPQMLIVSYFLPFFAPSCLWICSRLPGLRIHYLAHNVRFHEKWPGGNMLTRLAFKRADRIILLSQSCMRDLKETMPESIHAKAVEGFHPVYSTYKSSAGEIGTETRREEHSLLFFGLVKPYKGLDLLLKAMPVVLAKIADARLIVCGEVYGDKREYTDLIAGLGIGSSVETHFEYIDGERVEGFFRRASLCVLPYRSATQSGIIGIAFAFDLPVLATDVGGLGEYVKDGSNGILVPPGSPQALAEGIIRYFDNDMYKPLSDKVARFKQRYSWQALAELVIRP
jgi:glycosyltransferase involved in cell wall biosynthesis